MGKYGLKIKNYQAGSVYDVNLGVRTSYDCKSAMLTKSLFYDFLLENGLNTHNDESTRDVICIQFDYGTRTYENQMRNLKTKLQENCEAMRESSDEKLINKHRTLLELVRFSNENKEKFRNVSKADIRQEFYANGVEIRYPLFKRKQVVGYETVHYKMLYRSAGKAKQGSCMFICDRLYEAAHRFLWMGLELPEHNAPIVEIGAYSSLIASSIVGKVQIKPEEILVIKDVDAKFITNVIAIETNENRNCIAVHRDGYELKNTLFDGQALIDESIFPPDADGYILLRHHFTKMAAFHTRIQRFFHEYYGAGYDSATVKDMWGNDHYVKDIKLITTDNAMKWVKFKVSYEYWLDWVKANDCQFGIVKTAHESKLGDVQRMSYQMVNAMNQDIMDDVLAASKEYIMQLKLDDMVFLNYLKKNANFSNDYEVLIALCEHNPEFVRCDYFRDRKKKIISQYVKSIKTGHIIQNADNLVIVGSPYAMLLHAVGEDPLSDPTFEIEDGCTQCWTGRFDDGEYLAEFRSPFNSRNNLGYLHNHYHEYFDRYFKFGRLIIAINMNGTDFQDRNNGLTKWVSVQKCA